MQGVRDPYAHAIHRGVFRIATTGQNAADFVSHFEAGAAITKSNDGAGTLQTRNVARSLRRRVHSLTLGSETGNRIVPGRHPDG